MGLLWVPFFLSAAVQGSAPILFTVPKAGTYLASKCLGLLTGAKGEFVQHMNKDMYNLYQRKFKNGKFNFMHFRQQFEPRNFKALFMQAVPFLAIRDPRDVCVSSVYYYADYLDILVGPQSTFNERLSFTINYPVFYEYYGPLYFFQRAILLMQTINPVLIRFEDLVGPLGGGDLGRQYIQIYQIAQALNIPMNDQIAQSISERLFGGTPTFREGQIGSWKHEFTEQHIAQFKASPLEPILIQFGYEHDDHW